MDNNQQPSHAQPSFTNSFRKLEREQIEGSGTPLRSRTLRIESSYSLSRFDLESLNNEKGDVDQCSSPTTDALQDCSTSIEPETPCSNASTSDSEDQPDSYSSSNMRGFLNLLKKGSQMPFQPFQPLKNVPKLRRKSNRIREDLIPPLSPPTLKPSLKPSLTNDFSCFKSSWKNFTLEDLQAATDNFSHENLIGEGGYAEVYKGKLDDGNFVAIKRLTRGNQEEMTADFLSELGIIVHVDHPNIARLIGYGVEGGMHLVLQLSPHGSLSSILYGSREKLDWNTRYKIALGTAEGLRYLHEECQRRIIHRDIKASNILLLENFEPQISDFGLAKWLPDQWSHHTVSKFEGTFGYLPPEFFMHGIVDEKTDVYAYGVLLLELITGRQALDSSQKSLVMWAKPLLSTNNIKELVDPCLNDDYDEEQMKFLILTASLCIDQSSVRPQMNQVLQMSRGEEESLKLLRERQNLPQRTYSEELFDAEDYNSTKFLSDMDRHMETILGSCN
ncbi:PREDICTED: receptor-like cytosolic serine/threonine-protein kinase RBK2 isoform X1 [Lupinus angustifolius]|uniref:receptor-like cytosolic serine/threonine-protein kinase RBK2 isoform X1 n=1 Tax=Lupinus angustifolius TaxID=3871 RepID=UPI00092EA2E4|nr:PREDICTED: receptor-like cytosolic serine/threonine-protein kinase RBK2 isoform X1 [Lupinus angustifolius]XP_019462747.1 PREDICTED: receptor-like cytosolic serine/threonine-protein kinase RBK2 isoform X1 [Lupinus angustifolius]